MMNRYLPTLMLPFGGLLISFFCSFFSSCQLQGEGQSKQIYSQTEIDSIDFSYPVCLHHAKWVKVNNYSTHKEITLLVPGVGDTLATYVLYPRWGVPPQHINKQAIAIAVPVKRIACLSTPQIGTLPLLGASDRLVGAGQLMNINDPEIRRRVHDGKVLEIGRGMSENKESILMARPEVLLQDMSGTDEQDGVLIKLGVTPVLFNSWKEQDLLARAEWLKISGMLLGLNQRADSVFTNIAKDYQEAKQIAASALDTIPVLYGLDYKGTWYMPGEFSYPTAMMRDAALKYDYVSGEVNSTPVSFEYVFSRHRHAKVWISATNARIHTKQDFIALNERYAYFDAAKDGGKIFLDRKRVNEWGSSDYWESGPYRPDLILKDFIKMTRPELLPSYELYYFTELK